MILGTAFIDRKISRIDPKSGRIVPRNGHTVAIVESMENEDAEQLATSAVKKLGEKIKTNTPTCRVGKGETISP